MGKPLPVEAQREPRCRKCERSIDELETAAVDCDFECFAECEECDPGGESMHTVLEDDHDAK